jgi:hypothetical protein
MVFMPYGEEGSVKTVRKNGYSKFSHHIPCFRPTHEKGGKLLGCLELDPLSLPEEFLIVRYALPAVNLEPSCGEVSVTKVLRMLNVHNLTLFVRVTLALAVWILASIAPTLWVMATQQLQFIE